MPDGIEFSPPIQTLVVNIDRYRMALREAVLKLAELYAAKIEAYAKENARWTDRTSDARGGLRAFAVEQATEIVIFLVHSVFYGVFLELRFAGRYAIIGQSLEAHHGALMAALNRLLR